MNEPPGARARVGLTGLTVAEHFRDAEGQDVLLFIDNIFRFTQVRWLIVEAFERLYSICCMLPSIELCFFFPSGKLRSVCFAWSYSISCRLPTNFGY